LRNPLRRKAEICLLGSLGEHLEILVEIREAFRKFDRVWVTSEGVRAAELRVLGERVVTVPRLDRGSFGARSVARGAFAAMSLRPRVVVTTGAGLALPFCTAARALGARVIFIESTARVYTPSRTGLLLRRLRAETVVQWPELLDVYPDAEVARPVLFDREPVRSTSKPAGTFVTLGSHDQQFARLLLAVVEAVREGVLPAPVFAQTGSTEPPEGFLGETAAYLAPSDFAERLVHSEVVVTHGGAGAIAAAIAAGKRPIVLPRKGDFGEHVDDHQQDIVRKLAEVGAIVAVDGGIDRDTVTAARSANVFAKSPVVANESRRLVDVVAMMLDDAARS
jgi:UDP-N-acetylglucosamine transferase subunit ALG13